MKAVAEGAQFLFVEFLLLMRDVAPLAPLAQPVPFDGAGQNDGWRAAMGDGGRERGVHLRRVVTAEAQFLQFFVAQVRDQVA